MSHNLVVADDGLDPESLVMPDDLGWGAVAAALAIIDRRLAMG
jgi:hypothetical protein